MPTILPTEAQRTAFAGRDQSDPVSMVNLLKFKDKATYAEGTSEAAENLTGMEAYMRYGMAVDKIIESLGGSQVFAGAAPEMLIGDGDWDFVAIVHYPSRTAFVQMSASEDYQAIHYHREAGLAHQLLIDTTRIG